MWWFAAAHANLLMLARRVTAELGSNGPILDAGCGTGGLLTKLAREFPQSCAVGIDADAEACARAAAKSARPVCNGSVNALPFTDATFAAIFSADVLCHRDVDERQALAQFRRCLRQDGVLVLNLPAYRWMLSRHDAAVYNTRRYTRSGVVRLLRAAGFRVVHISYWNTLLFPVMVLTRKLWPGGRRPASDVTMYPPIIEHLCHGATAFERFFLRHGVPLPFGGSLTAVAAKNPTVPEPAHA
jgi:SAM-dependent methyltransferase